MEMEKNFVSDVIGTEYKNWKRGDQIFIQAPTGTGKSSFILYHYLFYAIENGIKILYLVNRRILRDQIAEELRKKVNPECRKYFGNRYAGINLDLFIEIKTYQEIEKFLREDNLWYIEKKMEEFGCVVYDECHYFYADAIFNTYTELSFDFLRKKFDDKVQIFMSATMNRVRKIIDSKPISYLTGTIDVSRKLLAKKRDYLIERNYDYVELLYFDTIDDLCNIVRSSKKNIKWLIFVDSINNGNYIQNKLLEGTPKDKNNSNEEENDMKNLTSDDVIFLDASYDNDLEKVKSVSEIVVRQSLDKKVLISTAVLDNGISLHDGALRNVAILADTEETFIQMLGRKRKDTGVINLYVSKRDMSFFTRRLNQVEKVLEWCQKNREIFAEMYTRNVNGNSCYVTPYLDQFYRKQKGVPIKYSDDNKIIWCKYENFFDIEQMLILQQKILGSIFNEDKLDDFRSMSRTCYFSRGMLALNTFAVAHYYDLQAFYREMLDEIEKDDKAFVKMQAAWLGISKEKVDHSMESSERGMTERYKLKIKEKIEEHLEKEMDRQEYIKWKQSLKEELKFFLKDLEDKKGKRGLQNSFCVEIGKNDRILSKENFEKVMAKAQLSYELVQVNGSYKFSRK